jgi:hypothetical protein
MSINVAMERGKEVVRLGSAETVLRDDKRIGPFPGRTLSQMDMVQPMGGPSAQFSCGSVDCGLRPVVSACILCCGGGLGGGNGTV